MSERKWSKREIRGVAVLLMIGSVGAVGACRKHPGNPKGPLHLVTRVDVVPAAEGCAKAASLIRTGLDRNGDGVLNDDELHEPPTKFCTDTHLHVEISPIPSDRFCPQPNRVVVFGQDADFDGKFDNTFRHNIIVCLDDSERLITKSYVVYGAR